MVHMIIVMHAGVSPAEVDEVCQRVRAAGLKDHPIQGTDRVVIACIGDERKVDLTSLETLASVERVMSVMEPYKLAGKTFKPEPSVVTLRSGSDAAAGGERILVMAGPCSVESREQLLDLAMLVKAAGAHALRGGAFKPRTNPYQFQGLGEKGLEILAEARERTGLAIVTEVMSLSHIELVARYADVLQIGTRNMHNFNLLTAAGETGKPILLKRGWAATLDEFLLAAEYIIKAGNPNVMLCERGIRTFEEYVRNTLALAIIPAVKRASHLPIIIDPSQGTGHAYMVPAMSRAAIAAGADGVIVEVHADPGRALTDGAQSITPEAFASMVSQMRAVAMAVGRTL